MKVQVTVTILDGPSGLFERSHVLLFGPPESPHHEPNDGERDDPGERREKRAR